MSKLLLENIDKVEELTKKNEGLEKELLTTKVDLNITREKKLAYEEDVKISIEKKEEIQA